MPIQKGDIKILESDTMNDSDTGGGALTGSVIIDGESNNIFEDISTLDRVYGAVHMRKVFPAVSVQNRDKYFGSHVIISKLPGDQKIGVNLFNTEDWFDRRPAAQSRVENYRAKGANYTGFLFATQYKGSKVVTVFQSETAPIPGIGEVLFLHQFSETETQFIKITKLDDRVQSFTDSQGTFRRRILEMEISQSLEYDFVGAQISRLDTLNPQAQIKQTVVANAAKYFSARKLATAGAPEDTVLEVDTVYSQVIPSSLQELSITDSDINGTTVPLVESGAGEVTLSISNSFGPSLSFYAGSPILPGSFSFAYGGATIVDEGGTLKSGSTAVGTINYLEGSWTFLATSPTYSGTKQVKFKPAAAPQQVSNTGTEAITEASRGLVYNFTMLPLALAGSVQVSYRALGEWYTLYDDGNGKIEGLDEGIGTGTVTYNTGTLSVTLAALPDEGSQIIYSWAKPVRYSNRSDQTPDPFKFTIQLPDTGIAPGSFDIAWVGADTLDKTATADIYGVISGDAVGSINHVDGTVEIRPDDMPLGGTVFDIDYQFGNPLTTNFTAPVKSGGNLTLDLGYIDIEPNTLELAWPVFADPTDWTDRDARLSVSSVDGVATATDDGNGNIKLANGTTLGTINYSTGIVVYNPDISGNAYKAVFDSTFTGNLFRSAGAVSLSWDYQQVGTTETSVGLLYPVGGSGYVNTKFRASDSPSSVSTDFTLSQMQIDLTEGFDETIVPGSVRFKLAGKTYSDPNKNGQLFFDINPTTGVGQFAGNLDYGTGVATVFDWNDAANSLSLESLLTERGHVPVSQVTFRIPNAPIRTGSLQIRATKIDGTLLTATSNEQGDLIASDLIGFIDYQTGVVNITFGNEVVAAGNESEEWYDPAAVDESGNIISPELVFAETMLYNAVSQTFLPLDSDILGLNPVRLPQDGRIPVFADGDVVVVLHDQVTVGTYSNAEVTDLGRGRIAKLSVRDSANQEIQDSRYTADLDNGTITWDDLSSVSQPLTITDRIEDMSILTDVQINGKLSLSQPLTHTFPVNETLVSNAVIYGDLFARTSIPFDQQTWTNVWSNALIGSSIAAQYNNTQYPIEVDNASAIQERWAIIFTSSTTVNVIGENVGQILSSVLIGVDIAPVNPNTAQPYFSVPSEGWGSGWSAGNVLRFNTYGANAPVWIIQSVGQGEETDDDYTFCLEVRGDIDTP